MPASTNETLIRQWELLRKLPTEGGGKTAAELVSELKDDGFDVSKRTVERDLHALSEIFQHAVHCNDKGKPYGWRWNKDCRFDVYGLTFAEAVALNLVEDQIRPLLPGAILKDLEALFNQSKAKLGKVKNRNQSYEWLEKVRKVPASFALQPPRIDADVYDHIREALYKNRQIEAEYAPAAEQAVKSYRLHPLAVVQRGDVFYLVASRPDEHKVKLYAVHRFKSVRQTDDQVERPPGFTIDDYIGQGQLDFGNGTPLKLEARVHRELANILEETPMSADMTLESQGGDEFRLTATVPDTWEMKWWLMGRCNQVEVIGPPELRTEIISRLNDAQGYYSLDE